MTSRWVDGLGKLAAGNVERNRERGRWRVAQAVFAVIAGVVIYIISVEN